MTESVPIWQIVLAMVTALGTPSLTYGVMRKMAKDQVRQLGEITKLEIGHIKERVDNLDEEMFTLCNRQKELRETTLPEKYVQRRDCEKCKEERREEDQRLHDRISGKSSHSHPIGGT